MQKIALIQPKVLTSHIKGHLGLAYLSAFLKNEGYEVRIFDVNINSSPETILQEIVAFQPECVGSTVIGFDYYETVGALFNKLKQQISARFIIGGPPVTLNPEKALRETNADAAVIGDGIPAITRAIEGNSSAKGVVTLVNNKLVQNEIAEYDLNNWPVPYLYFHKDGSEIPLVGSVGCWWGKCNFCTLKDLYVKLSYANAEHIVSTMKALVKGKSVDIFFFFDDNFLNNKKYLSQIVREMDAQGIRQKIAFQARPDDIIRCKKEITNANNKIARIQLGVESFIENVLERWDKGHTTANNMEAFEILLSLGIEPSLNQIIVNQKTDMKEIEEVTAFLKKNPLIVLFSRFDPYMDNSEEQKQSNYDDYVLLFALLLSRFSLDLRREKFNDTIKRIALNKGVYNPQINGLVEEYLDNLLILVKDTRSGKITTSEAMLSGKKTNFTLITSLMKTR